MTEQERYMKEAIRQAKKAAAIGEVPIGCVIVYEGKIIARGYNRRKTDKNTLAHAELQAIKRASKRLGDWRLEGCAMYVTLEPCQMCAGALVQARITEVVIGCMNPKAGCAGSILNLLEMPQFNHQVKVTRGVLEEECSTILKDFFKDLRIRVKEEKDRKGWTKDLTNKPSEGILFRRSFVIKLPHSRGVSGVLYLQSATAGVMPCRGSQTAKLPSISGVEAWVSRNRPL